MQNKAEKSLKRNLKKGIKMIQKMKFHYQLERIFAKFITVAAVLVLIGGIWQAGILGYTYYSCDGKVEGTVQSMEYKSHVKHDNEILQKIQNYVEEKGTKKKNYPIIKYEVKGKIHTHKSQYSITVPQSMLEGGGYVVDVLYNPSNPSQALLNIELITGAGRILVLFFMALVLFFIGKTLKKPSMTYLTHVFELKRERESLAVSE